MYISEEVVNEINGVNRPDELDAYIKELSSENEEDLEDKTVYAAFIKYRDNESEVTYYIGAYESMDEASEALYEESEKIENDGSFDENSCSVESNIIVSQMGARVKESLAWYYNQED